MVVAEVREPAPIGDVAALLTLGVRREGLWYRGQGDASWFAEPQVRRRWFKENLERRILANPAGYPVDDDKREDAERILNREFRTASASLVSPPVSNVRTYFFAQHSGFPTRLLDWSRLPLAALFFAVVDEVSSECDGALYVLDPHYEVIESNVGEAGGLQGLRGPLVSSDEQVVGAIDSLFEFNGRSHRTATSDLIAPLPIIVDRTAGRMTQQGSCFTLHTYGQDVFPTEHVPKKFTIPASAKRTIRQELQRLGITWETLFDDGDHVARSIRDRYGLWPPSA
ncbi:MAG: FRG domain-containing protein [Dehalococcoidia bacterium]